MKAKIVEQIVSEGSIASVHNMGYSIKRLVIEEADNLMITLDGGQIFVCQGFKIDNSCKFWGEVEVSDELVEKALAFVKAREELNISCEFEIKILIG